MKSHFRGWLIVLLGIMLIASVALISCAPDTSAPALEPTVDDELQDTTSASSQPELVAMDAGLPPFTDQACLDCHTDSALLMELAEPEEVVESVSEGPG